MYKNIIDPVTGKKHKTNSVTGKFIVSSYLQQVGGKLIGSGTYKCAVRPPITCGDTPYIYEGDPQNYVTLITTEVEAAAEKALYDDIIRHIDPLGDFTLPILRMCPISELDPSDGSAEELKECNIQGTTYPFRGLYLLISKYGGHPIDSEEILTKFSDNVVAIFTNFKTLFTGLIKIQESGFAHMDIKPANILLNERFEYYIIDFGLTRKMDDILDEEGFAQTYDPIWPRCLQMVHPHGDEVLTRDIETDQRKSPRKLEAIEKLYNEYKGYTHHDPDKQEEFKLNTKRKIDLYSLGIVMYKFLYVNMFHRSPYLRSSIGPPLFDLIEKMCEEDPLKRIDLREAASEFENIVKLFIPSGGGAGASLSPESVTGRPVAAVVRVVTADSPPPPTSYPTPLAPSTDPFEGVSQSDY